MRENKRGEIARLIAASRRRATEIAYRDDTARLIAQSRVAGEIERQRQLREQRRQERAEDERRYREIRGTDLLLRAGAQGIGPWAKHFGYTRDGD